MDYPNDEWLNPEHKKKWLAAIERMMKGFVRGKNGRFKRRKDDLLHNRTNKG